MAARIELTHFEQQLMGLCSGVGPTTAHRAVEALRPQLELVMAYRPACSTHNDRPATVQTADGLVNLCDECARHTRRGGSIRLRWFVDGPTLAGHDQYSDWGGCPCCGS